MGLGEVAAIPGGYLVFVAVEAVVLLEALEPLGDFLEVVRGLPERLGQWGPLRCLGFGAGVLLAVEAGDRAGRG